MPIYVQFADTNQASIVSVFSAPQSAAAFPNQGTVEASDPRWAAFYAMFSPSSQATMPTPTAPLPAPQQPGLRAQLAALDADIPRGLEDFWTASNFTVTSLPAPTQAKLAQKVKLRAGLAALIAAKTP